MLTGTVLSLLRKLALFLATAALLRAQEPAIRTTVPLVVAPASVSDRHGKPISGLDAQHFELLDDGHSVHVRLSITDDGELPPIAAVIAVQTSDTSQSALLKIRKTGSLAANAIAGEGGETAVLAFANDVQLLQNFTADENAVAHAFDNLHSSDTGEGRMIDALASAFDLLTLRPGARRALVVLISESKDRGSKTKLDALLQKAGHSAVTVYALTYSAYLTPFTTTASEYQPPGNGGLLKAITETARLGKVNTVEQLISATGGQRFGFATKNKLEEALTRLSADVHNRYLLTFQPNEDRSGVFHSLTLKIRNHADATVHVRSGYWPAE